jgi:CheY-like chemotaxis protein
MAHKVVLCDDEAHILRAAEIKLSRSGFEVRCATDGLAAWELLREWPPDVLVTDLQMPGLDGLELTRRLRADAALAGLPILMLTAKGFESSYRDAAAQLGILAVLPKPFSSQELIRAVQTAAQGQGATPATLNGAGLVCGGPLSAR